jgi:hypothetical protein
MEEAMGHPPVMKDLGERFVSHTKAIRDDDAEGVWINFVEAIEHAKIAADEGVSKTRLSKPQVTAHVTEGQPSIKEEITERVAPVITAHEALQSVEDRVTSQQPTTRQQAEIGLKRSWWQRFTGK